MNLFFTSNISDKLVVFTSDESKHISRVMRRKVGDQIGYMDGYGNWGTAVIQSLNPDVSAEIVERNQVLEPAHKTIIGFGVTKQMVRNEWFVEKATELGVDEILPFYAMHSQRRKLKLDRLLKITQGACKQSKRFWLPKIHELMSLEDALKFCGDVDVKLIATMDAEIELAELTRNRSNRCIFIGPEGGFTSEEIKHAQTCDFNLVSLGRNRLRAETAGIFAASIMRD